MGIRGEIEFDYGDDGFQSIESWNRFTKNVQGIIGSGFETTGRVLPLRSINSLPYQAMGSTLSLLATETDWCPRGYMQVQVENTFFTTYLMEERLKVFGNGCAIPISVQNQRSYNSFQEFIFLKELL